MIERLPLVSVVIASYNNSKYLQQCIESVLAQTYKNIELVVADDCSTDNSKQIVLNLKDKHPHIISIFNLHNMGACNNVNNAINQYTSGKYIKVLDSDDFLYNNAIEVLVNELDYRSDNIAFVYARSDTLINNLVSDEVSGKSISKANLLRNDSSPIPALTVLFRRDVFIKVGGYPKDGYTGDLDLWLKMVVHGFEFLFVENIVGAYRVNSSSSALSSNRVKMLFSELEIRARVSRLSEDQVNILLLTSSIVKVLARNIVTQLLQFLSVKQTKTAIRMYFKYLPIILIWQPRFSIAFWKKIMGKLLNSTF